MGCLIAPSTRNATDDTPRATSHAATRIKAKTFLRAVLACADPCWPCWEPSTWDVHSKEPSLSGEASVCMCKACLRYDWHPSAKSLRDAGLLSRNIGRRVDALPQGRRSASYMPVSASLAVYLRVCRKRSTCRLRTGPLRYDSTSLPRITTLLTSRSPSTTLINHGEATPATLRRMSTRSTPAMNSTISTSSFAPSSSGSSSPALACFMAVSRAGRAALVCSSRA